MLNAFNLLAGLIGIAGVFLSAWMYVESKRNEAVEQEKAVTAAHRLGQQPPALPLQSQSPCSLPSPPSSYKHNSNACLLLPPRSVRITACRRLPPIRY